MKGKYKIWIRGEGEFDVSKVLRILLALIATLIAIAVGSKTIISIW